jgi:glutaminase
LCVRIEKKKNKKGDTKTQHSASDKRSRNINCKFIPQLTTVELSQIATVDEIQTQESNQILELESNFSLVSILILKAITYAHKHMVKETKTQHSVELKSNRTQKKLLEIEVHKHMEVSWLQCFHHSCT